jgi:hypothetical protein
MPPPISDVTHITLAHCDAVGRGYPTHQFSVTINRLELLSVEDSKKAASLSTEACSIKLVAGVGFEPTTFRL